MHADYQENQSRNIDKVGRLRYSVGGSAFNIAANLSQSNICACLLTYLPSMSVTTNLIERQCDAFGIDRRFIRTTQQREEGGFVAHLCRGDLVAAVTSTVIDTVDFDESYLSMAVNDCRFLAIECNLSERQITQITRLARAANKQVVAAGVSEAKAPRIQAAFYTEENPYSIEVFSLNESELRRAFGLGPHKDAVSLCQRARSRHVVVTKGEKGFSVYSHDGSVSDYPAPRVDRIVSTSGCGDALVSCICMCIYDNYQIDWDRVVSLGAVVIGRVLASDCATPIEAGADALQAGALFNIGTTTSGAASELEELCRQGQISHSDDFTTINWYGEEFTLTRMQAWCIKLLWEHYERGTPGLSGDTILDRIGSSGRGKSERNRNLYQNIFKRNKRAWDALITQDKVKGTYRLNLTRRNP